MRALRTVLRRLLTRVALCGRSKVTQALFEAAMRAARAGAARAARSAAGPAARLEACGSG